MWEDLKYKKNAAQTPVKENSSNKSKRIHLNLNVGVKHWCYSQFIVDLNVY